MRQKAKASNIKPGAVVEVYWGDAYVHQGWQDATKGRGASLESVTVGVVVNHNAQSTQVCLNHNEAGQIGEVMVIPAGMISRIVVLKGAKNA